MANLKERNIALVSKDSDGVTTIDYPLTSTEMVEGLEEFVKTHSTSLTLPLPITKGGTGADNAEVARKNLGLAIVASSGDYNDLSNKPSIPLKPKAYIVETYRNGTEWYRVWSDGWLEQGGRYRAPSTAIHTITFLKPFANTEYTLSTQTGDPVNNNWYTNFATAREFQAGQYATTHFKKFMSGKDLGEDSFSYCVWYACGQGV